MRWRCLPDALFCFDGFFDYGILSGMIREMLPLDHVLQKRAELNPRKTFIKFGGTKYSYQEIDRLASVFASELIRRGMKPNDYVALLCHNCPLYIAAYFGIIRGGGVVLPLNNLLKPGGSSSSYI